MKIKDYLINKKSSLPNWLKNYKKGDHLSIEEVMSKSNIACYPGAGLDGSPIAVFNPSHFIDIYLYFDYLMPKEIVINNIKTVGCRGYQLLDIIEINKKELYKDGYVTSFEYNHFKKDIITEYGNGFLSNFNVANEYLMLIIFERKPEYDDSHGQERFAILYSNNDAFFGFYNLFKIKEYQNNLKVLIIRDHGFGGNYNWFSRGGLLEEMSSVIKVKPPFILLEPGQVVWKGYKRLDNVTDNIFMMNMHYDRHNLYINKQMEDCYD